MLRPVLSPKERVRYLVICTQFAIAMVVGENGAVGCDQVRQPLTARLQVDATRAAGEAVGAPSLGQRPLIHPSLPDNGSRRLDEALQHRHALGHCKESVQARAEALPVALLHFIVQR